MRNKKYAEALKFLNSCEVEEERGSSHSAELIIMTI
jgi:hypothetical protein